MITAQLGSRNVQKQLLSDVYVSSTVAMHVKTHICSCITISACLLNGPTRKLFYCPEGTVKESGVVCIYNEHQCDEVIDCSGGEDEFHCTSKFLIPFFAKLHI